MKIHKLQQGSAMLFFIIFFIVAAASLTFLLSRTVGSDLYVVTSIASSKQAYLTAESALEDLILRQMRNETLPAVNILDQVAGVATTTVTYDSVDNEYDIRSEAKVGRTIRVDLVVLALGSGNAFNYGLQTGNGGFDLTNSASITGNAFSNGSIVGQGSSLIRGDVISAGSSGLISNIHATGSAWANTLDDSYIEGDAHYNAVGGSSVVDGTRYTPDTMPTEEDLPIPDSKVEEWKDGITNSGSTIPASLCTSGVYLIDSNDTIGNVKIECDLVIKKSGSETIVTLDGPVWVEGNITLQQGPKLKVHPSLTSRSVQLIADNPSDRINSSKISIANSSEFEGTGHSSSFIMMLSQNESSELGGSEDAITIGQSSSGDLILYAGHGKINIGNQIYLNSVTGYRIEIGNNSDITYKTGLVDVLFTGGPGGGFVISEWYQE